MTKKFLRCGIASLFICLLGATAGFAEGFGIIEDPDGYVNVREAGSIGAKVVGRIDEGKSVWVYTDESVNWCQVAYLNNGVESHGFVHGSRIRMLTTFKKFADGKESPNRITFSQDKTEIEITSEAFNSDGVTISRARNDGGGSWIDKIDGQPFYGTDGGLPKTKYRSITIRNDSSELSFSSKVIGDLYQPNLTNNSIDVFRDERSGDLYLSCFNSDGAGGYVVLFCVTKGNDVDRLVLIPF